MRVIVPCDFTKVVPAAMSYAVRMSATENVQIDLLHIYEGGTSGVRLTKDQVQIHLEEAAQEYAKTYGVTVQALLREGTYREYHLGGGRGAACRLCCNGNAWH